MPVTRATGQHPLATERPIDPYPRIATLLSAKLR